MRRIGTNSNHIGGGAMSQTIQPTLTEGPIGKKLFLFAVPLLLGNVLQTLNGTINSIWVGKFLGESAFAATSNANQIMFFLLSLIFGIGMAATILIGQHIGAGQFEQAKKVVGTGGLFFVLLSVGIALFGLLCSPQILRWMHTPDDALPYAIIYLRIIFVGIPLMYAYQFLMMIMRGAGDSKTPFLFLLISTVLDISLNPLLIFGLGPLPRMGIAGSAAALVVSQLVSLVCLVAYLYRTKYALRITKQDLPLVRLDRTILATLLRKGIPMGLQMLVVSTSSLALINLINGFGSIATAAFGAAMQLSSYVQMPAMAIGGAVSSIAAQNVGAGKWDRVHRTTFVGSLYNLLMTGALVALIYLFNRQALMMFLQDEEAIRIGMRINLITLWPFILFGITIVVTGVVRATGAVMVPLVTTFIALWCIRTPLAYYFGYEFGLDALWWSFPIAFIVGLVSSIIYYIYGNWRQATLVKVEAANGT
jgi:putative MATE family efflux protein